MVPARADRLVCNAHSLTWSNGHLGRRAGERHEREDGNENCGVTHGVVLCGNAPRLLWARQVGVKAFTGFGDSRSPERRWDARGFAAFYVWVGSLLN